MAEKINNDKKIFTNSLRETVEKVLNQASLFIMSYFGKFNFAIFSIRVPLC